MWLLFKLLLRIRSRLSVLAVLLAKTAAVEEKTAEAGAKKKILHLLLFFLVCSGWIGFPKATSSLCLNESNSSPQNAVNSLFIHSANAPCLIRCHSQNDLPKYYTGSSMERKTCIQHMEHRSKNRINWNSSD